MTRSIRRPAVLFSGLTMALLATALADNQARAADAAAAELKVVQTLPVGGDGRWDYPLIDAAAHRLYIARDTRIMVLDSDKGTSVGEIGELQGAHGVALVPDRNLGFATSGRDNTIHAFDLKTLKTVKKIKAGQNPDAILYDPASQKVFAFCGKSGDATIIDPSNVEQAPASLKIGSKLETGVSDGAGHIYVNDETKHEIVAFDSKQQKVLGHWPLDPAKAPTGLAIDVEHHRLYAGCGNQKMAILDAETGKLLTTVPIGAGVDGVAFDPQIGAVSSNGKDGTISVVREGPAGQFTAVQTLATAKGAKTITVDPKAHRFYLPGTLAGTSAAPGQFGVVVVGLSASAK